MPRHTRVKICGLTSPADLETAVEAGADLLGAIVDVPVDTPREVTADRAAETFAVAPPGVSTVLVTMASTTGRVRELVERVDPDAVQLHGDVSPRRVLRIGSELAVDVLVAVDAERPDALVRYDGVADALLVDSLDDDGAGGTGETQDWDRTRETVAEVEAPVFLAGGLTPENVARAARTVRPYAVDVASGVERAGGVKDADAVRRFVHEARSADPGPDESDDPGSAGRPAGERAGPAGGGDA